MAKNLQQKKLKAVNIDVKANTILGTAYSQAAGVTITDSDLTLEFIYINPRAKTEGAVVSRITMPRTAGEGLAKAITDTIAEHEAKKKKGK